MYEQDGFVTSRQAELVGCPRSALAYLVRLGRMERVRRGVFRSSWGTPVMPRVESELYADFLLLDGGRLPWDRREAVVVVSHASAARLLRIGVLPAERHEFTSQCDDRHRSRQLNSGSRRWFHRIGSGWLTAESRSHARNVLSSILR